MSELRCEQLRHVYSAGTPFEKVAVDCIDLTLPQGQLVGLIGHTGSGKSTLIQHLNALLTPTSGRVLYDGRDINENKYTRRDIRHEVGLVFQYPEYQLFEETVYKDIAFCPGNMGLNKNEIDERVLEAARFTGIDRELFERSPLELSGGQKRRIAIAGVIAMRPSVLILDEPTAGLDPGERIKLRSLLSEFSQQKIVLISTHIVPDVEYIASINAIMKNGQIIQTGTTEELISEVSGKVWECTIDNKDLPKYEQQLQIVNLKNESSDSTSIRYLSSTSVISGSVTVSPRLEDLYLWLFGSKEA